MQRHRFLEQLREERSVRAANPGIQTAAFVLCPVNLIQSFTNQQLTWQAHVYQMALREALMVVRPSLPERDLAGVWN